MKTTVLMLALLISISGVAQVLHSKNQKFVRIFNLDGNKVLKGSLYSVSDSTLTIRFRDSLHNIAAADLGSIKYKRSKGSSVLKGGLIGGGVGAILGAASADPDDLFFGYTTGEGLALGFIFGSVAGGAVSGITGLVRKERIVNINGDLNTWTAFKNYLLSGGE